MNIINDELNREVFNVIILIFELNEKKNLFYQNSKISHIELTMKNLCMVLLP